MTAHIKTKLLAPSDIAESVRLLKAGEVVALPTETVYGLSADACNEAAIKKVFSAKGRPSDHPLIVHLDSAEAISEWACNIPPQAKILANHFWPGPLTMVFQKKESVSPLITGGMNTVALRVPNSPIMRTIIKRLGNGLVAPSANAYQKTSPTDASHVLKTLNSKIAAVVEGGRCEVGIESTIIDLTKAVPTILRPGAITSDMIEAALGASVLFPSHHDVKVSGNMEVHYQTDTPLFLLTLDEIKHRISEGRDTAIVHFSDIEQREGFSYYQLPKEKAAYTKSLYYILNTIDHRHDVIWLESPPRTLEWSDVNDRLYKAAYKA